MASRIISPNCLSFPRESNRQEKHKVKNSFDYALPDKKGYFGDYGGAFIPEPLQAIMDEITQAMAATARA